MRAGRLISMLSALEHHGGMTAAKLASELEVSERTVLRDVETLSAAGVPIYTVQGAGGGIHLMEGFRNGLTALTPDEAAALLLAGQADLAALLGLGPAAKSARRKLLQALPPTLATSASSLDDWFVHEPIGRDGRPPTADQLRSLTRAIQIHVEVQLPGADGEPPDTVRPLGLVLAAGSWQLVHLGPDGPQVRALDHLVGQCTLGRSFSRPADFDLASFVHARPTASP
jgi:predicted DNA-binding transcriptional regulator YafY